VARHRQLERLRRADRAPLPDPGLGSARDGPIGQLKTA